MTMTTLISAFDTLTHHQPFLAMLVDLGLKSFVILGLGFVITSTPGKMSASGKSLVWRMVIAALIALPFLQAFLPDLHIAIHSNAKPEGLTGTNDNKPLTSSIPVILALTYVIVSGLLIGHRLVGLYSVFRSTHKAREVTDQRIQELLIQAVEKNGISHPVTALVSDSVTSPVTWGFSKHYILFPATVHRWDDRLVEQIIGHELGHIYRNDWVQQLITRLVACFYWPNPLTLIAVKKMALEAEKACDDFAIDDTGCRIHYAENLVWLTQQLKTSTAKNKLAVGFIGARCTLIERIRYILLEDKTRHHIDRESCLPRMLLAVLLVAPLSATSFNLIEHTLISDQTVFSIYYYPSNSIQSRNFEAELRSFSITQ